MPEARSTPLSVQTENSATAVPPFRARPLKSQLTAFADTSKSTDNVGPKSILVRGKESKTKNVEAQNSCTRNSAKEGNPGTRGAAAHSPREDGEVEGLFATLHTARNKLASLVEEYDVLRQQKKHMHQFMLDSCQGASELFEEVLERDIVKPIDEALSSVSSAARRSRRSSARSVSFRETASVFDGNEMALLLELERLVDHGKAWEKQLQQSPVPENAVRTGTGTDGEAQYRCSHPLSDEVGGANGDCDSSGGTSSSRSSAAPIASQIRGILKQPAVAAERNKARASSDATGGEIDGNNALSAEIDGERGIGDVVTCGRDTTRCKLSVLRNARSKAERILRICRIGAGATRVKTGEGFQSHCSNTTSATGHDGKIQQDRASPDWGIFTTGTSRDEKCAGLVEINGKQEHEQEVKTGNCDQSSKANASVLQRRVG
ncbi:unnamed protein product, partial [Amoebophrya sp. A25]|eukprot:GSA25T00018682001.1